MKKEKKEKKKLEIYIKNKECTQEDINSSPRLF